MSRFFDVRMKGFRDRSELVDVLRLLDTSISILPAEQIPLLQLTGRVLAQPVRSQVAVPGFPRSAMDGYAVRGEETFGAEPFNPQTLQVVGESLPGQPYLGTVEPGQAVRIMTGAPLPLGLDAVVPFEGTQTDGNRVQIREAVTPGRHVARIGEDVSQGQKILHPGRRLRPQDIGILASIGVSKAAVVRRPRVALLISGNELLPPGSIPTGYSIVDSNSPMLQALVQRDAGLDLPVQYLNDRPEEIRQALIDTDADVILVSGGSSVGKEDHAPRLIAELGELAVHGIAVRPASPAGVGFLPRNRIVFLLPGNPVSCLCAYDLLAGRVIRGLGGLCKELPYPKVTLPLATKIVSAVGRVDYVRVRIENKEVIPIAVSGASMLSTTVLASGFVLVDRDREGHAPGEPVTVYRYDLEE